MMTMEEANGALKLFNAHMTREETSYHTEANVYRYYLHVDGHIEILGHWDRPVDEVYKFAVDTYL